jgi:hypothetical protein
VKLPHFTERSPGARRDPQVVLLMHPSFKLMSGAGSHGARHTVVVEFPTDQLHGWARFAGAFNLATHEVMSAKLDDTVQALYERIEWNGNNGWADGPGKRDALRDLVALATLGALDVDLLRGHMLPRTSTIAVGRLIKLAGQVLKGAHR